MKNSSTKDLCLHTALTEPKYLFFYNNIIFTEKKNIGINTKKFFIFLIIFHKITIIYLLVISVIINPVYENKIH